MNPEFIEKLRTVRNRVSRDAWLAMAGKFRLASGPPSGTAAANLLQAAISPDGSWALRQAFKEHGIHSWTDLATAFEVVDACVSTSPAKTIDIIWSGPANGTFPIRRIDQVLYDHLSLACQRIFLVTFAAHRVPLLCERLTKAIERGVDVTLLLESEQSSAGQLSHDASKAFKNVPLDKVRLLHWPIENREKNQAGKPGKLHVKCAVIDRIAIMGSANLTDDAFNRNMEMGVIVRDPEVVEAVIGHFDSLQKSKVIRALA